MGNDKGGRTPSVSAVLILIFAYPTLRRNLDSRMASINSVYPNQWEIFTYTKYPKIAYL